MDILWHFISRYHTIFTHIQGGSSQAMWTAATLVYTGDGSDVPSAHVFTQICRLFRISIDVDYILSVFL